MYNFDDLLKNKTILWLSHVLWVVLLASGWALSLCVFIIYPSASYLVILIYFSFFVVTFVLNEFYRKQDDDK